MKRCPKCDFSFVNSQHVCDFDGTDLVDDPSTLPVSPAVSALAATQSPFLRLVKSPVFLVALSLAGLVSSALLIGYYDAASQAHSIAKSPASQASPDSIVSLVPAQIIDRSQISTPAKDISSTRERSVNSARSRALLRSSRSIRNEQSRPAIALQRQPKDKAPQREPKESALQRDSKESGNRKGSKFTAALKTTWNILKKPFKF
jgi:hypothetical protein